MTRLAHNRSLSEIAFKAGVPVSKVKNIIIWGSNLTPDVTHGTIDGKKITNIITDEKYLKEEFIKKINTRDEEINKVKETSSVFDVANSVTTHLKDWFFGQ